MENNQITQVLGIVGMVPKGEYNSASYYEKLNIVYYNGLSYIAKKSSNNVEPTNAEYWQLISAPVYLSGTTENRPSANLTIGMAYFDTSLGKPIWYNGSNWVDSTGSTI